MCVPPHAEPVPHDTLLQPTHFVPTVIHMQHWVNAHAGPEKLSTIVYSAFMLHISPSKRFSVCLLELYQLSAGLLAAP